MTSWPSSSIDLTVPADGDFLAPIRALTRSAAVLADMGADDVEELQMAIDEAATLLLPLVDPQEDRQLHASLEIGDGSVRVALQARCTRGASVDRSSLAWIMLAALDPDVTVSKQGPELSIAISRSRVDSSL